MTDTGRVLVFCHTYRLEPETVRALFEQTYHGVDVVFTRDNPYGHASADADRANILHNLEKLQSLMQAEPRYEAAWIVESDVIPPRDALERLMAQRGDTVSGLYASRHSDPTPNCLHASAAGLTPFAWSEIRERWGEPVLTDGACHGCLLIRRHVLEAVRFRDASPNPPDWGWMQDVRAAGLSQACDTAVVCGHKRPDGLILWPTRERVEYERAAPSWWETW
ncbi:MAG: hypothetical protein WCF84_02320 [Anaerolineae bacterium]